MDILENPKNTKNPKNYLCETCDFLSCNKKDYSKHLLTLKHIKKTAPIIMNNLEYPNKQYICECGREYKYNQGLWKHKQTCCTLLSKCNNEIPPIVATIVENNKDDVIMLLLNQNKELIKEQSDIKQIILEIVKNGTNNGFNNNTLLNSNVNSLNKTFNLQFFLNETCKDAMNMTDFVDSIKFQLNDLEKMGDIGYVQGISNIITKNLQTLEVNQRPVHCTDQKRETIYIKDENKWEKEDDNKSKLRKIIQRITNKNMKILPQFREKHPDYDNPALKISDTYDKLVLEVMGGAGNNDTEKENKIIRNIAKAITITKLQEGFKCVD
jgi:hypothetical protein